MSQHARDASTDSNPRRRIEKLLKLRDLVDEIVRDESYRNNGIDRDEIARYIAETAYVGLANHEHSVGKGGIGYMPGEVVHMPEWVPQEMVALRITKPNHWVEALYQEMNQAGDASLAAEMTKAAGGFETSGGLFPYFMHLHDVFRAGAGREIAASPGYDGLIKALLSTNRRAAATQLLGIERPAFQDTPEYLELRWKLLESDAHFGEVTSRHWGAAVGERQPPLLYDPKSQQMLRELAERPEWSIHLYVMTFYSKHGLWYDQEVIDRIAAHNNPVSMRFLAARGLVEPTTAPQQEP